jgi:hypothetical protein
MSFPVPFLGVVDVLPKTIPQVVSLSDVSHFLSSWIGQGVNVNGLDFHSFGG